MRCWLLFAPLLVLSVVGCTPELDASATNPTATPSRADRGTATSIIEVNAQRAQGPTSTPAPWATAPAPSPSLPAQTQAHKIPHNLVGKADCLSCHRGPTYYRIPLDHAARTNQTCLGCHTPDSGPPAPAPHPKAGHEACLVCHLLGTNSARAVPGDHGGRLNNTCANCHQIK